MPAYGYVWTPGYWTWNADLNDYYWVDGAWMLPPSLGLLWTPGFWAWDDGVYVFNPGYWGANVGFYGGIGYGFGYWGRGYDGGYWRGRTFFYNRLDNNIGRLRVNALYEHRIAYGRLGGRASFNGGPGGVVAKPNADEITASHEAHVAPTPAQSARRAAAMADPAMRAGANHGRPALGGSSAPPVAHSSREGAFASRHDRSASGASHPRPGLAAHHASEHASHAYRAHETSWRPQPEHFSPGRASPGHAAGAPGAQPGPAHGRPDGR
jgi:hypothetical protein